MQATNNIIIIKIGSNVLITEENNTDPSSLEQLASQTALLQKHKYAPVYITSGAVAVGTPVTKLKTETAHQKRLAAGIGQAKLYTHLHNCFAKQKITTAQILLTKEDLTGKKKQHALKKILTDYLARKIVPILNENDVASLHSFGGNDYLAKKTALLLSAQALIILTDVPGILDISRGKKHSPLTTSPVISRVKQVNKQLRKVILPATSGNGIGGMTSKLNTAEALQKQGIKTVITDGKIENILTKIILEKKQLGTHFLTGQDES